MGVTSLVVCAQPDPNADIYAYTAPCFQGFLKLSNHDHAQDECHHAPFFPTQSLLGASSTACWRPDTRDFDIRARHRPRLNVTWYTCCQYIYDRRTFRVKVRSPNCEWSPIWRITCIYERQSSSLATLSHNKQLESSAPSMYIACPLRRRASPEQCSTLLAPDLPRHPTEPSVRIFGLLDPCRTWPCVRKQLARGLEPDVHGFSHFFPKCPPTLLVMQEPRLRPIARSARVLTWCNIPIVLAQY